VSAAASGSPVIYEELALYGTILTPVARLNKFEGYLLPEKTWNFQEIIFLLLTIRNFHGILSLKEILGILLLNINSLFENIVSLIIFFNAKCQQSIAMAYIHVHSRVSHVYSFL